MPLVKGREAVAVDDQPVGCTAADEPCRKAALAVMAWRPVLRWARRHLVGEAACPAGLEGGGIEIRREAWRLRWAPGGYACSCQHTRLVHLYIQFNYLCTS